LISICRCIAIIVRYDALEMTIDLRALRHALALAEHAHFGRAARAVHLTQPALSRSIKALEQRLGAPLFERQRNAVAPTDIGRVLLERARELLALADELDHAIVRNRTLQAGRVVVGGGPHAAEVLLAPSAARLTREYPQVAIDLRVRDWDELLRQLRGRELDFFVAETSTLETEADLEVRRLASRPLYFVARAGHPLARAAPGTALGDMLAYPLVASSRIPPRVLEPLLRAQRREHRAGPAARPFPSIQCQSPAAALRIVEASDAVTTLTLSLLQHGLRDGRLTLLGTAPWLALRYGLVRLRHRAPTHAAQAFLECVLATDAELTEEEGVLREEFVREGRRRTTRSR
jgi:DNA-binding transcriptional LysR family regulator